jgi:structural maintenance of chromosome 2
MGEFKNNKEGKIEELKVWRLADTLINPTFNVLLQATIKKQKAALQKESVTVKTHQKDVQTAKLELGEPLRLRSHQART